MSRLLGLLPPWARLAALRGAWGRAAWSLSPPPTAGLPARAHLSSLAFWGSADTVSSRLVEDKVNWWITCS